MDFHSKTPLATHKYFRRSCWKSIIILPKNSNKIRLQNNHVIQTCLKFIDLQIKNRIGDINTKTLKIFWNILKILRWFFRIELNKVCWFHHAFSKNNYLLILNDISFEKPGQQFSESDNLQ